MVDRFLAWRLPSDFQPDAGISFKKLDHPQSWPTGTNLLTATQAKQMIEHITEDLPTLPIEDKEALWLDKILYQIRAEKYLSGARITPNSIEQARTQILSKIKAEKRQLLEGLLEQKEWYGFTFDKGDNRQELLAVPAHIIEAQLAKLEDK